MTVKQLFTAIGNFNLTKLITIPFNILFLCIWAVVALCMGMHALLNKYRYYVAAAMLVAIGLILYSTYP